MPITTQPDTSLHCSLVRIDGKRITADFITFFVAQDVLQVARTKTQFFKRSSTLYSDEVFKNPNMFNFVVVMEEQFLSSIIADLAAKLLLTYTNAYR